jgi:glucan biosynthesis protein
VERRVWRVTADLVADRAPQPVEIRAFLRVADRVLTETWSYQWSTAQ